MGEPAEHLRISRGRPLELVSDAPAPAARTEGSQLARENRLLDAILAGEFGGSESSGRRWWRRRSARGVRDEAVLRAMLRVPRQVFVSDSLRPAAYADSPQRIGHGQTISQPYIVALMTELARPTSTSKARSWHGLRLSGRRVGRTVPGCVRNRDRRVARRRGEAADGRTRVHAGHDPLWRRLSGLARPGPLRPDHRRGRAQPHSAASRRPIGGRRTAGIPVETIFRNSWSSKKPPTA